MPYTSLDLGFPTPEGRTKGAAIEEDFPCAQVSKLSERESYRKEIFRPLYHIHKWWANRLGSVFRAIALGTLLEPNQDIWSAYYKRHNFKDKVVLDPFMGSGTTLGEAVKLGAQAIGCDINPVSTFLVQQALTFVDLDELDQAFDRLRKKVSESISYYYRTIDPDSQKPIPVLYYFWVMVVETPEGEEIPLFRSYVFSKNAYPARKPDAKVVCPSCWQINSAKYDTTELECTGCSRTYNPQCGPANGQHVTDSAGKPHKIADLIKRSSAPPRHRHYATLALRDSGEKVYLPATEFDEALFKEAQNHLDREETLPIPTMAVRPGHNTDQARRYNYNRWCDFFNPRQLLCLGLLLREIQAIENILVRNQFLCLFSGTLEFNNQFCSFKGEGTGAVRHMFSHHILKPERLPLENSVWGASKSSGTFVSLYRSRLLHAKRYLQYPTDILLTNPSGGSKAVSSAVVVSEPLKLKVTDSWEVFCNESNSTLVLNGDSAQLPLPDRSVDAVITDPPYFDFVHYSELSDFFFAWLTLALQSELKYFARADSSHVGEVQQKSPHAFSVALGRVFSECHRVLKDDGVLTFSFHHSKVEGWSSIYQALDSTRFLVTRVYPVHAEMNVASPKSGAKNPISLDMILVCKKRGASASTRGSHASKELLRHANEIQQEGIRMSTTDKFNIEAAKCLMAASSLGKSPVEFDVLLKQTIEGD